MSTPPHHPTYNVHASDRDIKTILRQIFPDASLLTSIPLPHGESYNNRIYHVSIVTPESSPEGSVSSFVLKVGGNRGGWKGIKIINEVMCLKLVKFQCPEIPVPEVVSWSHESGKILGVDFEWILMTKLSGQTLQSVELRLEDIEPVANDLARYLSALRKIPSPGKIGNIVDVHDDGSITLGKLVDSPEANGYPFKTYLEYQQSIFIHNIEKLEKTDTFRPNHRLLPSLRQFLNETLQELALFKESKLSSSVFTHGDLSERNILVSRLDGTDTSRMCVSGIVDFEFSGFFSPFDEYLLADDEILASTESETSGPILFPNVFIDKLEQLGTSTARSGFLKEHWETASYLARLLENIAPWWLEGVHGEELVKELEKAADCVNLYMRKLNGHDRDHL